MSNLEIYKTHSEEKCANCEAKPGMLIKVELTRSDGYDTEFVVCKDCLWRNTLKACNPDTIAPANLKVRTPQ